MLRLSRCAIENHGSVSIAAVACIFLILLMCLCMVDLGLYVSARFKAQDAADASALAAVQESFPLFSTGAGTRNAAYRMAKANGGDLEKLSVSAAGDRVDVEVSVRAPSLVLGRLGVGPRKAGASSAAEVDFGALLSSNRIWYTADPAVLSRIKGGLARVRGGDFGGASTMVALLALSHLGKPYVWGATGPNAFDCSGLVCYVYAQLGVSLPRVTFSQVRTGREVRAGELAPGDLVFFRHNAHVGIYLGGGWFIHAPHTGDVVRISALGARSDLSACRRIL